ncbi:ComF family protein [soil metagenome]
MRFAVAVPRCERCAIQVPPGVRHCGACLADPPPHVRALAAVDYGYPWNELIGHFKFHAALDLAPALAQRMLEAQRLGDLPAPTLILPVPLSAARLRDRGYNQSWELARRIATALRCEADARLLLRMRDTPHQIALPPDRRDANVRGAFAIEPMRRAELQGREVTLIDDAMTTGATLAEASRVLLQAGAVSVQVWVVAHTPER